MTVTYDEELEFQALKRFMAVTNEVHVVIHPITPYNSNFFLRQLHCGLVFNL